MKKSISRVVKVSTVITMIGVPLFWVVLGITQSLKPEYNPMRQSISDLALGTYGWLQTLNFILLALVAVFLGIGTYCGRENMRFRKTVFVLFLAVALGEIISAVFQVNLDKTHMTVTAFIHQAGAIISAVAVPLAALFMLPGLKVDPYWQGLAKLTLGVAISMLALGITRQALVFTDWLDPWFGLYERVILLIALAWIFVIAFRMWLVNINT